MNYQTFPGMAYSNYNEGDTFVHELGHFFGLFHIFSDSRSCDANLSDMVRRKKG